MHYFWLVVMYICFFSQGALVPMLGPLWPRYVREIGVSISDLGIVNAIMFAFAIVSEISTFKLRKK